MKFILRSLFIGIFLNSSFFCQAQALTSFLGADKDELLTFIENLGAEKVNEIEENDMNAIAYNIGNEEEPGFLLILIFEYQACSSITVMPHNNDIFQSMIKDLNNDFIILEDKKWVTEQTRFDKRIIIEHLYDYRIGKDMLFYSFEVNDEK